MMRQLAGMYGILLLATGVGSTFFRLAHSGKPYDLSVIAIGGFVIAAVPATLWFLFRSPPRKVEGPLILGLVIVVTWTFPSINWAKTRVGLIGETAANAHGFASEPRSITYSPAGCDHQASFPGNPIGAGSS